MASALSLMKTRAKHYDWIGWTTEGVFGAGAGYGLGYLHGRYRGKWYGDKAPTIAAIAGKALGALAPIVLGGHGGSAIGGVFNGVGQAGVTLIGCNYGLKAGAKAAGKQAVLMPAGALPAGATAIGALPPAGAGRGLSWDQIEELASMH